jgi:hypothetical protein
MIAFRFLPTLVLVAALGTGPHVMAEEAAVADTTQPRLQILNGNGRRLEVFRLGSDGSRESAGSVGAGKDTILDATLGERFALVGEGDKSGTVVTSSVPVQAVRFDPPDKDGIPAFYTQRIDAHGYPIVASAKVNPYALREAAHLVDLMLAKRPDIREAMIRSGSRMCLLAWNEFIFALILARENATTLQVGLINFRTERGDVWELMAAAGVFIVIPAFIAAIAIQKHFVAGLTGGAVK